MTVDIGTLYLNKFTNEKIYTCEGPDFKLVNITSDRNILVFLSPFTGYHQVEIVVTPNFSTP